MTVKRFIVENNGPDTAAVQTLFQEATKYCASSNICEITLLVSSKTGFSSTVVGEALGEKNSKALTKGGSINIGNGISLNLEIPKNIYSAKNYGLVIGLYLPKKDLATLDSIRSAAAIAFLPWIEDEGKKWMATWSPLVWGKSSWIVNPVSLTTPVEKELNALTAMINLGTGLAHPSDKNRATDTLKNIKALGNNVTSTEIEQWAVKNGWAPRHAETLAKLAYKILDR